MFECHITLRLHDADIGEEVAKHLHWSTSQIARDPVLGKESYFYLTTHGTSFDRTFMRMKTAIQWLNDRGARVVREKIEDVVYDVRHT